MILRVPLSFHPIADFFCLSAAHIWSNPDTGSSLCFPVACPAHCPACPRPWRNSTLAHGCWTKEWVPAKLLWRSCDVSSPVYSIPLFLGKCLSASGKRRPLCKSAQLSRWQCEQKLFHPALAKLARAVCPCYASPHWDCPIAEVMFEGSTCALMCGRKTNSSLLLIF